MEKQKFARVVAREINRIGAQLKRLVLVAPVRTLNQICDGLDPPTASKLVGTLRKDLIKVPDHELEPHLKQWAIDGADSS